MNVFDFEFGGKVGEVAGEGVPTEFIHQLLFLVLPTFSPKR